MDIVNDNWEHVLFAISVLAVAFILTRIQRYLVGRFFKAAARKFKVDHSDLGIQLRIGAGARNAEGFELKCALYKSFKERFDQEGITLAFPHRMVITKNPELS